MTIAIGYEHAAVDYGKRLVDFMSSGYNKVLSVSEDKQHPSYPSIAEDVAKMVVSGKAEIGILICGTGIGMCMAAGKVPGIRAALCTDSYMGAMAKKHNNANILIFGSRVIGYENMLSVIETFCREKYEGGRHDARIKELMALDDKYKKV